MSETEEIICLNCGTPVQKNFCPNCGQSREISRITLLETIRHFLDFMLSFNGPLLSTLTFLFIKPGKMFREYLAGARKKYYNPVSLFVLIAFIHILIRNFLHYKPIDEVKVDFNASDVSDEAHIERLFEFMSEHVSDIYLALAIAFALSAKMLFRKCYNFAEYLTIGFYATCTHMLVQTVMVILEGGLNITNIKLGFITLLLLPIYYIWSLLKPKTTGEKLRAFGVGIFSTIFYVAIISVITAIIILV